MFWSIVAFACFAGICLFGLAYLQKRPPQAQWPFYAKRLMTPAEQVVYDRLVKAVPEHRVFVQVGLSRILGVKKGSNFGQWHNRINRMSVDYAICTQDSTVIAVVELDDKTHALPDRKLADAKKDRALAAAGVRIHRINVKSFPDISTLRLILLNIPAVPELTTLRIQPRV